MCPLRLILIFLSATLAGFFVLRNLKSKPETSLSDESDSSFEESSAAAAAAAAESPSIPLSTEASAFPGLQVCSAICSGFWTLVDMASGRYLWRNLVSSKRSD
ncbi:uncharacterized protein LOC122671774 isoform X1 [Telopea speciosissima]|uniref:uncharacterized protein LOC122671774 isoform X1 n=1 Tax=Telopea speciosissima TaxID=54955 RepID=UPI001CC78563|nr:uncharacterized protein LOC122671774 isoform X1 [Telopea speciosissima]